MKHTLTARLKDLILEIKLWFFGWLVTSVMAILAVYFYLHPDGTSGWFWHRYIVAKLMKLVGLGELPVIPGGALNWTTSSIFLDAVADMVDTTTRELWASDFLLLLEIPLGIAVILATAFLAYRGKN